MRVPASRAEATELLAKGVQQPRAAKKRGGRGHPITLAETLLSTEVAFNIGVSERTVKEDSRVARAWLMKELAGSEP